MEYALVSGLPSVALKRPSPRMLNHRFSGTGSTSIACCNNLSPISAFSLTIECSYPKQFK